MARRVSFPLQCCVEMKQTQSLPLKKGKESLLRGIKAGGVAIRDSLYDS